LDAFKNAAEFHRHWDQPTPQMTIQARIVVLIAVLVIARKLMLQDFASTTLQTMLGFSGLLLSLGGLYWLISDGDRRRLRAASRASPDAAGPDHSRLSRFKRRDIDPLAPPVGCGLCPIKPAFRIGVQRHIVHQVARAVSA
jgi:hypothetical protein